MRTFTYSVFDIYGTTEPKIPSGWVDTDFRPPLQRDAFLRKTGGVDAPTVGMFEELEDMPLYETPYIILRKKKRGPKKAVPAGRTSGGKK